MPSKSPAQEKLMKPQSVGAEFHAADKAKKKTTKEKIKSRYKKDK